MVDLALTADLTASACTDLADLLAGLVPAALPSSTPLIAPVLLMADAAKKAGKPMLDVMPVADGQGMTLHEYQAFRMARPLISGQSYNLAIAHQPETKPGAAFGFESKIADQSGAMFGETQTTLRRLSVADIHRLQGSALPRAVAEGGAVWLTSKAFHQAAVDRYLNLSGDINPIHSDAAQARAQGLAGVIVPGMLIIGLLENVVSTLFPAHVCPDMRVRFMAAIGIDETVRFAALDRGVAQQPDQRRARVFAVREDDTIAFIADLILTEPVD